MASLPERLANPAVPGVVSPLATLTAAISTTPAAGTFEQWGVSAAAPTPLRGATGRFTAIVDNEIIRVFAGSTGASPWYVERGCEGSTPATHGNGSAIYHIVTASSLAAFNAPSKLRSRRSSQVQRDFWAPSTTDHPVVTLSAANAASAITGAAADPSTPAGYTKSPNDPRIVVTGAGGPMIASGGTWPANIEWKPSGAVTKALGNVISYELNFDFYGTKLEVAVLAQGNGVNIFVNGYKEYGTTLPNDGTQRNILLDWSGVSATPALRRIRVECSGGTAVMGFYHLVTEDMLAPSTDLGGLRLLTTGDSWTDGTGTTDGISAFPYLMGQMLGIQDAWLAGIGGTGYLQTSNQGNNLRPRIATDIVPFAPDIVFLSFGSDDTSFTPAQIAAEAVLAWEQIMSSLPNSLLVVMGPYACPAAGGSPTYPNSAPINTALANAAASLGVQFINPVAESWITGTGYTGATNGSGSSDTLIGPDGIHPSQAGHNFMARRVAQKLAAIIEGL